MPGVPRLFAFALAGCHVVSQIETTRPGEVTHVAHPDQPVAKGATVVVTDAGMLRFVEPLECPSEDIVEQQNSIQLETEPNMAAFVVGIVATAVGGLVLARSLLGSDPVGSPLTYVGGLGLALGLPLAIGPWIGTSSELRLGEPLAPIRRPGPSVPCGERGIAARTATVTINETDVRGRVDDHGVFSVSPYELLDAYQTTGIRPWNISAAIDTESGTSRTITAILDGATLAGHARAFLDRATFDARIEPMRLVPGLVPGALRVSLTTTADGPVIRVVLPIQNTGPGEAWAVRGAIASPVRALDGRMIYIGHVAKGETVTREVAIPIAGDIAAMIRGATILVSVELRDAHGTAPQTPVRFTGKVDLSGG